MPCSLQVKVKDPTSHLEVTLAPEKVYVIRNHMGKVIKIGLFKSPKTGQMFRALLPESYTC
ncbi:MAG: chromatin protein Cren7 [Ignisphaera sp.]